MHLSAEINQLQSHVTTGTGGGGILGRLFLKIPPQIVVASSNGCLNELQTCFAVSSRDRPELL